MLYYCPEHHCSHLSAEGCPKCISRNLSFTYTTGTGDTTSPQTILGSAHLHPKEDVVNRPKHYTSGKYETIDVIEDWGLGFCLGNAVKYISRCGKKDPTKVVEDLEKAIWYIKRHIKALK